GSPVMGNSDLASSLEDKETIAADCDPKSPHYGRLYVVWSHYRDIHLNDTVDHFIAFSDDQGMTWFTPTPYSTAYGYFAQVHVGKGGTVFIASSQLDRATDTYEHGFSVSHDG